MQRLIYVLALATALFACGAGSRLFPDAAASPASSADGADGDCTLTDGDEAAGAGLLVAAGEPSPSCLAAHCAHLEHAAETDGFWSPSGSRAPPRASAA